ncbi:hypothetical protein LTR66_010402 [Elasticomyces elasticus]|nr:hypothetical protein LTR28_003477 [Elasticomyces elasticus]KAK4979632.1 hypothetical protein LTR66_010402 [Elasticomyces elasticus]
MTPTTTDAQQSAEIQQVIKPVPFFFREKYSELIVKGNFMTLAACPALVDEGEWLAHQVVQQNQLLNGNLKMMQEVDTGTRMPLCNQHNCPKMFAGPHTTYTWLDENKRPVEVPAPTYISYVQKWIDGKVTDVAIFPTDTSNNARHPFTSQPSTPSIASPTSNPFSQSSAMGSTGDWLGKSSGFPEHFESTIKSIYRQMFRCYTHLYYGHWQDFWDLGAHKPLNTCFLHFINVGRVYGLITDKDVEPMQPLLNIWTAKDFLKADGAA